MYDTIEEKLAAKRENEEKIKEFREVVSKARDSNREMTKEEIEQFYKSLSYFKDFKFKD